MKRAKLVNETRTWLPTWKSLCLLVFHINVHRPCIYTEVYHFCRITSPKTWPSVFRIQLRTLNGVQILRNSFSGLCPETGGDERIKTLFVKLDLLEILENVIFYVSGSHWTKMNLFYIKQISCTIPWDSWLKFYNHL